MTTKCLCGRSKVVSGFRMMSHLATESCVGKRTRYRDACMTRCRIVCWSGTSVCVVAFLNDVNHPVVVETRGNYKPDDDVIDRVYSYNWSRTTMTRRVHRRDIEILQIYRKNEKSDKESYGMEFISKKATSE
eukprot:8343834-Heterocapsa_arctica.AAC.1